MLTMESHLAGITGPCPACGSLVTAPSLLTAPPERTTSGSESFRHSFYRSGKGRIIADCAIDQRHLDRRESSKTLRIVLLFILAFCACVLVTWFMTNWIRR